jgi:hypothetical protein
LATKGLAATSGFVPAITRVSGTTAGAPLATSTPPATGIGPGSHLIIFRPDGEFACTANFVWKSGTTQYLGAAGHCFLAPNQTATHGPGTHANVSKVRVSVCVSGCYFGGQTGFIVTGTLVPLGAVAYARQTQNGQDIGNDFGLVTIPASLASQVRRSLPVWGGPTQRAATDAIGSVLCHYGYGVAAGETFPTQARTGIGMGATSDAWYADLAAAPGDSGSAVETCAPSSTSGLHGVGAVGILTHLTVGSSVTAGTTVAKAITMAKQAGLTLSLLTGA